MRLIRDPKGMRKFVPQLQRCCSMPKRTVSYPETWLNNWRTEESDQVRIWWPSWTWRLYGDRVTKVLWAWKLEKLISSGNNFIFDTFRNFEPVKRFENMISRGRTAYGENDLTNRASGAMTMSRDKYGPPGCLFTNRTSYILTYLFSHDINVYHSYRVRKCGAVNHTSWKCLRGSMVAYAGDRGSNPAARTILFFFGFYFLDVRSSLYSGYTLILNHLDFDSRFFVFSTAKLSLHLAVHAFALMLFTVYGM